MIWTLSTDISIVTIIGWIIPFVMLFFVPVNRKPSSATAWLMLIFLLPYFGLIIFLLIGSPKLSRRRRTQQRTMDSLISKAIDDAEQQPELTKLLQPVIPAHYESIITLNTNLGYLPAFGGNSVELLPDYNDIFKRISEEIDAAKKFVHIEYFAFSRDEETECVFAAMERAVKRGIKVRILMDHLGSRKYPHFKKMRSRLTAAGIENHLMLELHFFGPKYSRPDLRNHRKIVVIDGQVAFTGSQNLIKRNYFRKDAIYYDELVALIKGPIAAQFEAAFATDWFSETGFLLNSQNAPGTTLEPFIGGNVLCQVLPSGSGFENENNLRLFTSLIHAAKNKLVITNPYFVPDDALMLAITSAALRGVDVTLLNSAVSDQFFVSHAERSYYEDLLNAGVRIYRYNAPILLHSKLISIDDHIAVIGSSNLDIRSFQLNLEVTLVCYDSKVVADLREIESAYIQKSRLVFFDEWKTRNVMEKLFENICRLTSALQ